MWPGLPNQWVFHSLSKAFTSLFSSTTLSRSSFRDDGWVSVEETLNLYFLFYISEPLWASRILIKVRASWTAISVLSWPSVVPYIIPRRIQLGISKHRYSFLQDYRLYQQQSISKAYTRIFMMKHPLAYPRESGQTNSPASKTLERILFQSTCRGGIRGRYVSWLENSGILPNKIY